MGIKDTGTGKTVQLIFLSYSIFGSFNIRKDYMVKGYFDSRAFVDWLIII